MAEEPVILNNGVILIFGFGFLCRYALFVLFGCWDRGLSCFSGVCWLGEECGSRFRANAHLSDDKTVAKMGHPVPWRG